MARVTKWDVEDFQKEELRRMTILKEKLKGAIQSDFSVVKLDGEDGDTRWAVSLYACNDIAVFIVKDHAQRFIDTWPEAR